MFDISRTALTLFGVVIHWYAVLIVSGVLAALWLGTRRERLLGLPRDTSIDVVLLCVPAALVGARAYFVLFSLDSYLGQPFWKVFAVWEGGMAIYGGIIAGVLTGWFYGRKKKLSFIALADLAMPSVALGQAIGRWGNFLNQEAYGVEITSSSLQFFPVAVNIGGKWHCATFFYESLWCFLIVAVILLFERKHLFRSGFAALWYVFLYALERGVVEGLRTDSLYWTIFGNAFRVSQVLSLLLAAAVTVLCAVKFKKAPMPWRVVSPALGVAAATVPLWGGFAETLLFAAAVLLVTLPVMVKYSFRTAE